MTNRSLGFVRILPFFLLAFVGGGHGPTAAAAEPAKPRQLAISNKPWTGDFDKMLERRVIRVYAPFSRSLYFNDKGRERGIAVELVRDWERYLNVKYAKQLGKRPLTIYIGPATRDKLLPYLVEGLADVSIGNLTITDERLKARREAEKRGLDPDKWFNNVELVIAQQVGTETTTYVRNIYKYYVAYRLMLDAQAESAKVREQMAPKKN